MLCRYSFSIYLNKLKETSTCLHVYNPSSYNMYTVHTQNLKRYIYYYIAYNMHMSFNNKNYYIKDNIKYAWYHGILCGKLRFCRLCIVTPLKEHSNTYELYYVSNYTIYICNYYIVIGINWMHNSLGFVGKSRRNWADCMVQDKIKHHYS